MNKNIIYLRGKNYTHKLSKIDIERFIAMYLFSLSRFSPLTAAFLKEKNYTLLSYLSEYILKNNDSSLENPLNRKDLTKTIVYAIKRHDIDITMITKYDEEELLSWQEIKYPRKIKRK